MKRTICFCLSFIILICAVGCSKKSKPVTMSGLYTIKADVTLNDFEATISLNRLGNGVWDVSFTKPDSLSGLDVSYENDNAKVTYKGLAFMVPREDIPINAIVTNLTSVLDDVSYGNKASFTKNNNKITAKGTTDNGNYKVVFDEKSGKILSLEIEDMDLTADFSEYKPMK